MNQIDDADYKELVIAECKEADGIDPAPLYADITRWRDTLTTLIEEVEEQFELKRSDLGEEKVKIFDVEDDDTQFLWMEAKAKFDTWAAKANSYKRHLMKRKRDVVRMLKEENKVNDAIEHARRNVLTVVGSIVNMEEYNCDDALDDIVTAYQQYQTAVQMKGAQS